MFQQDYIMRQIEMFARTLALLVFRKEETAYELREEEAETQKGRLYRLLRQLTEEGKINEAEDRLFEALDPEDLSLLEIAIDFYMRLNAMEEEEMERAGYSREEIQQGLTECAHFYGVDLG